jgi:hypothetical protein
VKTGVQDVANRLILLDSGFRRNDGQTTETNFFTPSGGVGVFGKYFSQNLEMTLSNYAFAL